MENAENPLLKYMRRPKSTLDLSSKGKFWPSGSLAKAQHLDVFPMTGQDEILLLNVSYILLGSILAEIIKNCVPDITDVWSMPRIDLDSVLIAIRCASYNESMNVQYLCPACSTNQTHTVNLQEVSHKIVIPDYDSPLVADNLAIWFRPVTFKEHFQQVVDQNSKLTVIKQLSDDAIPDDEKQKIINDNLREITRIKIESLANNVDRILVDNQIAVTENNFIKEWLLKLDREMFATVSAAISKKIQEYSLPSEKFVCKNVDCKHTHELPIDFNPADFLSKGE